MTSSGQGQNDIIMTSPGSGENSGRVNDRVRIRVGPGQKFGSADDVSMTSANGYRTETRRLERPRACLSLAVAWRRVATGVGAWRRVAGRPASSGVVPPINFLVSTSRFQICNNIKLSSDKKCRNWTKTSRKNKQKTFFFFYVLILIYGKL